MSRVFRPIAVLLSVLLLANTPVQAGPVAISEVMQVIGSFKNPPELRLRSYSQIADTSVAGARAALSSKQSPDGPLTINYTPAVPTADGSDSLLAGVAVSQDNPQTAVEVITQGDIQGTICDCGEIIVPGGFPKWPLLFLAAIPFFFINHGEDTDTITPFPTPTPIPTLTPTVVVPEPASVLLFGSGLLALGMSIRRRYGMPKLTSQADTTEGS